MYKECNFKLLKSFTEKVEGKKIRLYNVFPKNRQAKEYLKSLGLNANRIATLLNVEINRITLI